MTEFTPPRLAYQVLVVGATRNFGTSLQLLQHRGYRFEQVADTDAARTCLLRQPADAALLCLPGEDPACEAALKWLRIVKDELPVVVISTEADIQPYLAAMENGAFDYVTSLTPMAEMERVLANAVRWRRHKVA